MAADRDQVRLGKNLQQILVLQCRQGRAEIQIGPESKQVQQIADRDGLIAQLRTVRALRELQLADTGKVELLRCCRAHKFRVQTEKVRSDASQGRAIYRCEFDLQHDLLSFRRRCLKQIHDRLGVHGCNRGGLFCSLRIRDNTR